MISINDIKPNPDNPRVIKDEKFQKLCKSITDFPRMLELRPIIVDDAGVILGGNMRHAALKHLGFTELQDGWVVRASDLTEEQKREFVIKDNVGFGEWDLEILAKGWSAEELDAWGLDLPEFKEVDPEVQEDDYEVPDEIETDIVLGDLIEIGPHRLLCGDSTDSENWDRLKICENSACFTSPPYNAGKSASLSGNKSMSSKGNFYGGYDDNNSDYIGLLQGSLSNAVSYAKGICFNVQPLAGNKIDLLKWLSDNASVFVDVLIWDKGNAAPPIAQGVCTSRYEWLCVFSPSNNSRRIPLSSWKGTVSNVYSGPPQRNNEYSAHHAATFPVHLPTFVVSELMNTCSGVVDPFMGTGTTMVAAHQLGRKSYGIELDPKYCQVIVDRMRKLDPAIEIKRNGEVWH